MPKKTIYPLLLIATISLLIITGVLFFKNYVNLKSNGKFHNHKSRELIVEVDKIQKWMTFDFINRSFSLPDDYLKNQLSITDIKYPKITLGRVSVSKGEDVNIFTNRVKDSVKNYIIPIKNPK